MITLVRVLFWVPAVALVASIVYLMNWNKERFYLAILTLPAIYFMWKVFNYNYFEPDVVLKAVDEEALKSIFHAII
ncbi:hypothetical protein NNN96_14095, partial [Enterococcus faecium]|nr:hypothetical protein [Enterococcus faecium]